MKTAFSLESQLDSAGPGASQNLIFSKFFEMLVLGVFLGPCFFDFYRFLDRFDVPLGAQFGTCWRHFDVWGRRRKMKRFWGQTRRQGRPGALELASSMGNSITPVRPQAGVGESNRPPPPPAEVIVT